MTLRAICTCEKIMQVQPHSSRHLSTQHTTSPRQEKPNMLPQFNTVFLLLTTSLFPFTQASTNQRIIAGVSVIDTPLVRAAQTYAQEHGDPFVYKHIMRSWLFGSLILQHNATLAATVDKEVHAVAALLHDLGWDRDPHSHIISFDKRFEVDGAIAAREFILSRISNLPGKGKGGNNSKWDKHRIQLVWDAIALHTQSDIAYYKEPEVEVAAKGIGMDFQGPGWGVTKEEYDNVLREFPNGDLKRGVNETIIWLCAHKAGSTYDTWMQPWGDQYVANYSSEGNRAFDFIFANLP
ncbi:hypothetical protein V8F20_006220 [Naviculisporaceae sp. PSN 640]